MSLQKKNIIRVLFLFIIALGAFGFRNSPARPAISENSVDFIKEYNYVDIYIWRNLSTRTGDSWATGLSNTVPVRLDIAKVSSTFRGVIPPVDAFGYMHLRGVQPGGFVFVERELIKWNIWGTFYPSPDCSLVLVVDELIFPHVAMSCHVLAGCVFTPVPAINNPNIQVNVPLNQGYAKTSVGVTSTNFSGNIHVAVVNVDLPDETCTSSYSNRP